MYDIESESYEYSRTLIFHRLLSGCMSSDRYYWSPGDAMEGGIATGVENWKSTNRWLVLYRGFISMYTRLLESVVYWNFLSLSLDHYLRTEYYFLIQPSPPLYVTVHLGDRVPRHFGFVLRFSLLNSVNANKMLHSVNNRPEEKGMGRRKFDDVVDTRDQSEPDKRKREK